MVLEQDIKKMARFGEKKYKVSPDIKKLRINCWESIFGDQNVYDDPIDEFMWEEIQLQAEINDNFYWTVFGQIPHNSIISFNIYKEHQMFHKIDKDYYFKNKDKVKGFAVIWPIHFLRDEFSMISLLDVEAQILPSNVFT